LERWRFLGWGRRDARRVGKQVKRVVVAAVLAAAVVVLSPGTAGAWATYCEWDPLVPVVTPAGNVVLLYDSVWTSNPIQLGLPIATTTTSRVYVAGKPATAVDTAIWVPSGLLLQFPVQDMVTTGLLGTGEVLATKNGWSNQTLHLKFTLKVA
jgi:hypothetical protein